MEVRDQVVAEGERVVWLRDTQSTLELRRKLHSARRVLVVGNGGIALELVHEIQGCEVQLPWMGCSGVRES